MDKRKILIGALLMPSLLFAQTAKEDSVIRADLSLVGMVDDSALDVDDDGYDGSQNINTTVLTSHDVFLRNAAFQLSPMRYRVRGYKNIYEETYINGLPFNDQLRGVFNYSSIGAINNLTRNGDRENYTTPGAFSFGALGGSNNILMRAGDYGKGGRATVSYTNRNYWGRAMVNVSTGVLPTGWAFTGLVGGRYSDEGNIKGTFYRNVSYAFLAEKQWDGGRQRVNFATFGSPVVRGQQNGSVQEVYDLVGDNLYNSNWGYQNGKKRNSRVVNAFDPTAILSYEGILSENTKLNLGLSYHFGHYGKTALNWYNGADPRPDYYRYLPSYFDANGNDMAALYYEQLWRSGDKSFTQVNWDSMIEVNQLNAMFGDGNATYMVEERVSDLSEATFNATINTRINNHFKITGGLVARNTISHQFKLVDDLLGAKYVLDVDKFSDRDFAGDFAHKQKDLNRPNRRVYEGGIFDYDFKLHVNTAKAWINNQYSKGHWDAYYGMQLTHTDFYRDGNMKNGHHPDNSYGKSAHQNFTDIMLKGGATYKFTGRHILQGNIMYGTIAPLANDAYISSRYSDETPEGLKSSRIFHADLSYIFATPFIRGRISAFDTEFKDQTERSTYYYDGVTLVNQVMTGVNKRNIGIEAAATMKLTDALTLDMAGTVAQYYYTNNPMCRFSTDNGREMADYNVGEEEKVYMKNIYQGGVPQFAGTIGLRYFINYWFLGASLNGVARNYVQATPARRVSSRYAGNDELGVPAVAPGNEYYDAYRKFTHQERFGSASTVDLSIGKIIYLGRRNSININLAFNNILNRKNIKTGGYEQGRIDLKRPTLFGNRYFYMQGFNCYLNFNYNF